MNRMLVFALAGAGSFLAAAVPVTAGPRAAGVTEASARNSYVTGPSPRPGCRHCPEGGGWVLLNTGVHRARVDDCATVVVMTRIYSRETQGRSDPLRPEVHTETESELNYASASCAASPAD
jgi:hypothetical protein